MGNYQGPFREDTTASFGLQRGRFIRCLNAKSLLLGNIVLGRVANTHYILFACSRFNTHPVAYVSHGVNLARFDQRSFAPGSYSDHRLQTSRREVTKAPGWAGARRTAAGGRRFPAAQHAAKSYAALGLIDRLIGAAAQSKRPGAGAARALSLLVAGAGVSTDDLQVMSSFEAYPLTYANPRPALTIA